MDKSIHTLDCVGLNYLSISKRQRATVEVQELMSNNFSIFYCASDYLSMLRLKLNHVSEGDNKKQIIASQSLKLYPESFVSS